MSINGQQKIQTSSQVAYALDEAMAKGTSGMGYNAGISAVAKLAEELKLTSAGRAALVQAAQEKFDGYRKVLTRRGGQSFDDLSVASDKEKMLFSGLSQKMNLMEMIAPDEARHYTKYGVEPFIRAFTFSPPHLRSLDSAAVQEAVSFRVSTELGELYQSQQRAKQGTQYGQLPVLEQVATIQNSVRSISNLDDAVKNGAWGGANKFLQQYQTVGVPAVEAMAKRAQDQHLLSVAGELRQSVEAFNAARQPAIAPAQQAAGYTVAAGAKHVAMPRPF